jgi:HD-GYP domain-containing protein (c-di-GMP phosphodiesterase class II)
MITAGEPSVSERLVHDVVRAVMYARLYGPKNSRLRETVEEVLRCVRDRALADGTSSVVLAVVGGQAVLNGDPVLGTALFVGRFASSLAQRGSGGIEVRTDATVDELLTTLDLLSRRDGPKSTADANAVLSARGVRGVTFVPPPAEGGEGVGAPLEEGDWVLTLHRDSVELLEGVTIASCLGREIDLDNVRGCIQDILDGLERDASAVLAAADYPQYDLYTFGHSMRVCLLALDVGRSMTADSEFLARVGAAALLHDVGKALIAVDVLHKPGRLTPDERREIERHPLLGAGLLVAQRRADPLAVAVAYGHHRTPEGLGYPRTCGEYHQSTVTRLVKICDAYEALTAVRPYKPAMAPERALRVMLAMKGHFDPDLLKRFVRHLGVHPIGTVVRLGDGRRARVVRQSSDPKRPVVVPLDADGLPEGGEDAPPLDLSDPKVAERVSLAPDAPERRAPSDAPAPPPPPPPPVPLEPPGC